MGIKRGLIFAIGILLCFIFVGSVSSAVHTLEITGYSTAVPADTGGSDTGGGGGGTTPTPSNASFWIKTYDLTSNNASLGISYLLGTRERMKLLVHNEMHYVGVVSFAIDSAVINIASNPMNITFGVGEEKKFDFNSDGFNDMAVKVNSIKNGSVNVSVKEINEFVINKIVVNNTDFGNKAINEITKTIKKIFGLSPVIFYLIVFILIIGIIVTVIIIKDMRKNMDVMKKIKLMQNSKENEMKFY